MKHQNIFSFSGLQKLSKVHKISCFCKLLTPGIFVSYIKGRTQAEGFQKTFLRRKYYSQETF
jgi:hypothetical protein